MNLSPLVKAAPLLTAGVVALSSAQPTHALILAEEKSDFSKVWVYEENCERCLTFAKPPVEALQTCFNTDEPQKILFDYQKFFLSSLFLNPSPKNALVIGLGGGTTTMTLLNLVPGTKIDTVEINKTVADLAKKYFNFKESDRIKLFIEDGFKFVANCAKSGKKYDLIFVDAFSKDYIPPQFLSNEFVLNLKQIMTDDCVVAVNTWPGSPYEQKENDLYQKHFGWFYNLSGRNRIIMIGPKMTKPQLNNAADLWHGSFEEIGIDTSDLVQEFSNIYPLQ